MTHRPELLTPSEVAELLRVTPRTIRCWASAGRLQRISIGAKVVRYRESDVRALLGRCSEPHNDERPADHTGRSNDSARQGRHGES